MKTVGLVVNFEKPDVKTQSEEISAFIKSHGMRVRLGNVYRLPKDFFDAMDLCVTVGGDGTILGIASQVAQNQIPVIGINAGKLGFLTALGKSNWEKHLGDLLEGESCILSERLLECDCEGQKFFALNDVVVKNQDSTRLFGLRILIEKRLLNEYWADGLIFATPLGSTAYSLSAGGSIIAPQVNGIMMTPICPHTLSNRSVILPEEVVAKVEPVRENSKLYVCVDGKNVTTAEHLDSIAIRLSQLRISIVQPKDYSYFDVLRNKLGWK